MDNTGNDLRHEIKFENCEKNKNKLSKTFLFFLEQKYIFSYSWKSSFYNFQELNCLSIFEVADAKNVDMPRQC